MVNFSVTNFSEPAERRPSFEKPAYPYQENEGGQAAMDSKWIKTIEKPISALVTRTVQCLVSDIAMRFRAHTSNTN
jgi:hypothetical protein